MNTDMQRQYAHFIREKKTPEGVQSIEDKLIRNYGSVDETLKIVISNQRVIIKSDEEVKKMQTNN